LQKAKRRISKLLGNGGSKPPPYNKMCSNMAKKSTLREDGIGEEQQRDIEQTLGELGEKVGAKGHAAIGAQAHDLTVYRKSRPARQKGTQIFGGGRGAGGGSGDAACQLEQAVAKGGDRWRQAKGLQHALDRSHKGGEENDKGADIQDRKSGGGNRTRKKTDHTRFLFGGVLCLILGRLGKHLRRRGFAPQTCAEDPRQQGGEQGDKVQAGSECPISEQRHADGTDEKGGAGGVGKGQQMGQLRTVDTPCPIQRDGTFGTDGRAAQQSQQNGAAAVPTDAEQAADRVGDHFSDKLCRSRGDQKLRQHHEGKEGGNDGADTKAQAVGHMPDGKFRIAEQKRKQKGAHQAKCDPSDILPRKRASRKGGFLDWFGHALPSRIIH